MLVGRSIVWWIVIAVIVVAVFTIARWLIPYVFGLLHVSIPDPVVVALCILIAVGVFIGGYRRPVA